MGDPCIDAATTRPRVYFSCALKCVDACSLVLMHELQLMPRPPVTPVHFIRSHSKEVVPMPFV
eukprot:447558-Pelagomonas_calceolata.AAC.1